MNKNTHLTQTLRTLLTVIAGNFLYALAVKLFLLPSGLITGGTTGIALAVQHLTGLPVSTFVLIFNMIMLVVGFLILGKQFAATTVVSTFAYPLCLKLSDRFAGNLILTQDLLLCAVFSGLGIGIALGIVIRAGASTGGMDIPPLVLYKTFRIPVSASMYVFDFIILLMQAVFYPAENVLYGIILVLIYTMALDKLLLMGTTSTEVKVISQKSEEIREAILTQVDRGVTLLEGEGGYLHQKQQVLLIVVANRELPQVEKKILSIDPESFLIVGHVSEVRGRGFSMSKRYR